MLCNIGDIPSIPAAIAVIISASFCLFSIRLTLFASAFFLFFLIFSILCFTGSSGSANFRSNSLNNCSSVSESEEEEYDNLFLGLFQDDGGFGSDGGDGSGGGGGGSDFLKSVRTTRASNKSQRISSGLYSSLSFPFLCGVLGTPGQTFRS